MWYKFVVIIVVGALLLGWPFEQQVVQSDTASNARIGLQSQVAKIAADGASTDMVKVIITLKQPVFARNSVMDAFGRQQRAKAVRVIQQDFVGRQAARIKVKSAQPEYHPVVFGEMRRQDVAALATDSGVIGVQEDKPVPVLMMKAP